MELLREESSVGEHCASDQRSKLEESVVVECQGECWLA
jgi:hypothetical protein